MASLRCPRLQDRLLWLAGLFWLAGIAAGIRVLWSYKTAPGGLAEAPGRWPASTRLSLSGVRPTLLLFAHPRCACTRASLGELDRLLRLLRGRTAAYALFLLPEGLPEEWARTDSWRTAERIPGLAVLLDKEGAEAGRFGALTSGQVLLYDAKGRLRFNGGLTAMRGHLSEGAGFGQIASLVRTGAAPLDRSRVFGCALSDPRPDDSAGARSYY